MATLNPPAISYATPSPKAKPLPFGQAVWFFAIPSLAFAVSFYGIIPALVRGGMSEFTAYMTGMLIPCAASLVAALAGYLLEGHPLNWAALSERFWLRRMSGKDWLWSLGGLLVSVTGYELFMGVSNKLVLAGVIPLPDSIPAGLHPALRTNPAAYRGLLGPGESGSWGIVALIGVVLFFNVVGEEIWWRGYILPRQDLAHGRRTWMVHWVMWTLFHAFEYWQWLGIVAVTLPISYIACRQRNTWTGIAIHGLNNLVSMFGLWLIVLGIWP